MADGWDQAAIERLLSARGRHMGASVWAAAQAPAGKVYSFAGGLPDVPTLPRDLLEEAIHEALEAERKEALEYGGLYGAPTLRKAVAEREGAKDGITLAPENVLINSGSAQAIHNVCDLLLDPGDVVLIESPHFPGTLRTIRAYGAEMVPLPMDGDGLLLDAVEEALDRLRSEGRHPKFLFTIPNFQNPTGATLTLERRRRLVELCAERQVLIVEDDAYGDMWADEPPPPSLSGVAGVDGVLHIGTFSKVLATGLRVAWTVGAKAWIDRLANCRFDMGTTPLLSRAIARVVPDGRMDQHLEQVRPIYKAKRDALVHALHEHCEAYARWHTPAGGFFLWLELRPGLDARDAARLAMERGFICGAGSAFFADGGYTNHLRLAFSGIPLEDIEPGVRILAEVLGDLAAAAGK